MGFSFNSEFDQFGQWRENFAGQITMLGQWLTHHGLADAAVQDYLQQIQQQLSERGVRVGFVAESRRGKSKLINAVFFTHYGRQIIKSHPLGATLCPIELGWDAQQGACLRLLPIETREQPLSLAHWRSHPSIWVQSELNVHDAAQLAGQMAKVAELTRVSIDQARTLGFWTDGACHDNPIPDEDGMVEIPKWRYALVNLPHPLLQQGLVIVDMPGLLAASTEPEINVHLIGQLHNMVFLLAADEGVTANDLEVWRTQLLPQHRQGDNYLVVLNKIDALTGEAIAPDVHEQEQDEADEDSDPQSNPTENPEMSAPGCVLTDPPVVVCDAPTRDAGAAVDHMRQQCADLLQVPVDHVWPVSATLGMHAKTHGDEAALARSGLGDFELALTTSVLERRRTQLHTALTQRLARLGEQVQQTLTMRERDLMAQLHRLRQLPDDAAIDQDQALLDAIERDLQAQKKAFRASGVHVQAMRSAHLRLMNQAFALLGVTAMREESDLLGQALERSGGVSSGYEVYAMAFERLRGIGERVRGIADDLRAVLAESFAALNAQFGFVLPEPQQLQLGGFDQALARLQESYLHYLSSPNAAALLGGGKNLFAQRLRHALELELQRLFEAAARDLDVWSKTAMTPFDAQLQERQASFSRGIQAIARMRQIGAAHTALVEQTEQQLQELHSLRGDLERTLADLHDQAEPPAPVCALDLG